MVIITIRTKKNDHSHIRRMICLIPKYFNKFSSNEAVKRMTLTLENRCSSCYANSNFGFSSAV